MSCGTATRTKTENNGGIDVVRSTSFNPKTILSGTGAGSRNQGFSKREVQLCNSSSGPRTGSQLVVVVVVVVLVDACGIWDTPVVLDLGGSSTSPNQACANGGNSIGSCGVFIPAFKLAHAVDEVPPPYHLDSKATATEEKHMIVHRSNAAASSTCNMTKHEAKYVVIVNHVSMQVNSRGPDYATLGICVFSLMLPLVKIVTKSQQPVSRPSGGKL